MIRPALQRNKQIAEYADPHLDYQREGPSFVSGIGRRRQNGNEPRKSEPRQIY